MVRMDGDRDTGERRWDRLRNRKIFSRRLWCIRKICVGCRSGVGCGGGCGCSRILAGCRGRARLHFRSDKQDEMDSGSTRRKPHGQCLRIHSHMTKREQHGTDTNTGSHGPEHFQCKRSCSNESFGRCFLTPPLWHPYNPGGRRSRVACSASALVCPLRDSSFLNRIEIRFCGETELRPCVASLLSGNKFRRANFFCGNCTINRAI